MLLAGLGAIAVSIAAGEVVLAYLAPTWTVIYPPVNFRPDFFEAAPFGYRLKTGPPRPYNYPPLSKNWISLEGNAQGFRGRRAIGEPDARPRIVVLGDSMVFGQGVEENERFTDLMEAKRPEWRVENLGMVGFGVDLMLRALEQVGLDPPPAVVVLAVYSHDLRRAVGTYTGMGFRLPKFVLENGRLRDVPFPELAWWERSRLYQGMQYAYWRYTSATFPLNEAILERFRALAAEHRFVPIVLFLPPKAERFDDRMRRRFVADWAKRRGVAYLDLTPALDAAGGGDDLYVAGDPHWSARGHAVVERAVEEIVEAQLAPAAKAPAVAAADRASSTPAVSP